jgi:hypothetical protein
MTDTITKEEAKTTPIQTIETGSTTGSIRRSGSTRSRKKKSSTQIYLGFALFVVALGFTAFVANQKAAGGAIWIIGLGFGYLLQRSRFCFTAAFRDPMLTGGTNLSKALIVGMAVATVGFAAMQFGATGGDFLAASRPGNVHSVGLHTAVGAFLFGLGAVIAGGCASGTLMRVGEGFQMQMLSLVFFIVGSVIGVWAYPVWKAALLVEGSPKLYLPALLGGWIPALIVQFGLLLAVWMAADWWARRNGTAE